MGCLHGALAQLGVGEQRVNSLEAELGSYQTIEVIRFEAQVPSQCHIPSGPSYESTLHV